jgi:hypothetical protein
MAAYWLSGPGTSRKAVEYPVSVAMDTRPDWILHFWRRTTRELGGESLLAVRISVGIEQRLGVARPVVSLFEFPTIAQLAKNLASLLSWDRVR